MPRQQIIRQNGDGIKDNIAKILTGMNILAIPEYEGEKHARFNKNESYNFLGPGTALEQRRKNPKNKDDFIPKNSLDSAAKKHDLSYEKLNNELVKKKITVKEAIELVNQADEEFLDDLKKIKGFDLNKIAAAKAIFLKNFLENKNILDRSVFSINDDRQEEYDENESLDMSGKGQMILGKKIYDVTFPTNHKLVKKMKKKDNIQGGFAILPFLIPVLVSIAADLGKEGVKKLYEHFSNKEGSGKGKKIKDILFLVDDISPNDQIELTHSYIKKYHK